MDLAFKLKERNLTVVPGWKLCRHCYDYNLKDIPKDGSETGSSNGSEVSMVEDEAKAVKRQKLDKTLGKFSDSILKTSKELLKRFFQTEVDFLFNFVLIFLQI